MLKIPEYDFLTVFFVFFLFFCFLVCIINNSFKLNCYVMLLLVLVLLTIFIVVVAYTVILRTVYVCLFKQ